MDSDMDTNPDTNPDRNQQTATYISRPQRTYPDRNVPIQTATDNDRTPRAKRVCDWLRDFKFNFLIYRYVEIRWLLRWNFAHFFCKSIIFQNTTNYQQPPSISRHVQLYEKSHQDVRCRFWSRPVDSRHLTGDSGRVQKCVILSEIFLVNI